MTFRLAELQPRAEGPVTLVFATIHYRRTVLAWIDHARRAGCRHFRIVCMDRDLRRFLADEGAGAQALEFHEVLPQTPGPMFAGLAPGERLRALTPLRVRLFAHLAGQGIDFIHSDADAFWRADPRPWLGRHPGYDLLCSQGTIHPLTHYQRHRFTLCAGFFLCRAGERTRRYFRLVDACASEHPSDQVRMNAALLRDPAARWRLDQPVLAVRRREMSWFGPPGGAPLLRVARAVQRHAWLRAPVGAAFRLARLHWIFTSRTIIHGRFSGGLTVGIVPMHVVMRGRFEGWGAPLVMHASANKRG